MPPGTALEVVSVQAVMSERVYRTESTAGLGGWRGGGLVTTPPPPPHQDGQRKQGRFQNSWDRGRLA